MVTEKISKSEYQVLVKEKTPNNNLMKNLVLAFFSGGFLCLIGEFLSWIYKTSFNMQQKEASILVSITMVFLGAFLTGIKVYDNWAKHAGAGTLVPITGFSNSITSPAIEFKSEGQITGIGVKMFVIAGPVLVFGITSSIIYGIIAYIFKLY